jgi:hypothetical protein
MQNQITPLFPGPVLLSHIPSFHRPPFGRAEQVRNAKGTAGIVLQ